MTSVRLCGVDFRTGAVLRRAGLARERAVLRSGARRRDALRADAPARVRVGMTELAIVEDAGSV
jgi:hypothetical protein